MFRSCNNRIFLLLFLFAARAQAVRLFSGSIFIGYWRCCRRRLRGQRLMLPPALSQSIFKRTSTEPGTARVRDLGARREGLLERPLRVEQRIGRRAVPATGGKQGLVIRLVEPIDGHDGRLRPNIRMGLDLVKPIARCEEHLARARRAPARDPFTDQPRPSWTERRQDSP